MPTVKKRVKAIQDVLRMALVLSARARDRAEKDRETYWFQQGRTEGIRAAQRVVEVLSK